MIVDQDIHPEQKIYYWGAMVIESLKVLPQQEINYFDIYQEMKSKHDISIGMLSLTLNWLFILGVIENNEGRIKKCF